MHEADAGAGPRLGVGRSGRGDSAAGTYRTRPHSSLRPAPARRDGCDRGGRRGHGQPGGSAREAPRRASDRAGVLDREARARRAPRRRCHRRLPGGRLKDAILGANGGNQVDAVFEMAGGEMFDAALQRSRPSGAWSLSGSPLAKQNEVATGALMRTSRSVDRLLARASAFPIRPAWRRMIGDLFGAVEMGDLEVVIGDVRPLSDAKAVHEDLAARRTQGKILLDPGRVSSLQCQSSH